MSSESPSTGHVDDYIESSAGLALEETISVNSSTGKSDELDERVYKRVFEPVEQQRGYFPELGYWYS